MPYIGGEAVVTERSEQPPNKTLQTEGNGKNQDFQP
jgi:hypothetical protein